MRLYMRLGKLGPGNSDVPPELLTAPVELLLNCDSPNVRILNVKRSVSEFVAQCPQGSCITRLEAD